MTRHASSLVARLTVGVVLALVTLAVPAAHAAEPAASSFTVKGMVEPDGALGVSATIVLEGSPAEVRQRFATSLKTARDTQYVFTLSDWKASVGGAEVTPTVTTESGYEVVAVPTAGTSGPVVLSYTVRGAALDNSDGTTTVNWRLLQGLSLPVRQFDAVVRVPGVAKSIDCYAGSPANPGTCRSYVGSTGENPTPEFHDGGRGAGEVVGVVLRFSDATVKPNQSVQTLWTLDNAFSAAPLPLGVAAALAALGCLGYWLLHRRFGRDVVVTQPIVVGSFKPVGAGQSELWLAGDLRPGEVGTLLDERVDPIDVTASVLDLAVRNHLLITQLPRESQFKATDWELSRVESAAALLSYEKTLLDAVAPASGGPRRLGVAAPALVAALPAIQAQLYDEVVRKGWFRSRPDSVRSRWNHVGWLAVVAAVLAAVPLIAFSRFGLAALVLLAIAAAVGFVGSYMPARTARGAATLAGLGILRGNLLTQPTEEMPKGREHEELSQVLPYAVVLGGADRWLDGIAAVNDAALDDATELSWYHGPEGWQLSDLPDSLRNFVRAFQGTLVAR